MEDKSMPSTHVYFDRLGTIRDFMKVFGIVKITRHANSDDIIYPFYEGRRFHEEYSHVEGFSFYFQVDPNQPIYQDNLLDQIRAAWNSIVDN